MADNDAEAVLPDDGLDAIDRSLIVALQADGRMTYAELGAEVGLSAGGARLRVRRLEEREIVQVVGVTDPLKLGYERMAMLHLSVEGDVRAVADAIGALEGVIYLVIGAGSYDLLVEVIAVNADALLELINGRIRTIPGVSRCETFSYYNIHTHRFTWGTR
ncbi:Lrp/AsnC family transcriptional regulator [Cryobacterium algoricola]|uniref:Lrp/AsnC family transcriptional regulator n=2 Tax=Cryobacterium TaxID=69578 RepID=A0AA41QW96_9MICO|nr:MULTISPECIES: Lrp/AsnC family transcriptional regulator [Cryobacterium]MCI4658332.1 Lrp/AsnC family transcriptional regulator [Cryobacterium zhongshanensis]TFB85534.1 Lrp/AsnC family transcriptional regulator [Cryobacterium algoricola]